MIKNDSHPDILSIELHGISFLARSGAWNDFWNLMKNGDWENETFVVFDKFIDKQHSYLDIGSWIGPTLMYGAQKAKKAHGLEPDAVAFAELKANVALNSSKMSNVVLHEVCIAPRCGSIALGADGDLGSSKTTIVVDNKRARWIVTGMTLQVFMEKHSIEDCNFIKMDIEGGEYRVVPETSEYLRRKRPTLYLSLHPFCLGCPSLKKVPLLGAFANIVARFWHSLRLVYALRHYKYRFDPDGNLMSQFSVWANSMILYSLSVVFTDLPWPLSSATTAREMSR